MGFVNKASVGLLILLAGLVVSHPSHADTSVLLPKDVQERVNQTRSGYMVAPDVAAPAPISSVKQPNNAQTPAAPAPSAVNQEMQPAPAKSAVAPETSTNTVKTTVSDTAFGLSADDLKKIQDNLGHNAATAKQQCKILVDTSLISDTGVAYQTIGKGGTFGVPYSGKLSLATFNRSIFCAGTTVEPKNSDAVVKRSDGYLIPTATIYCTGIKKNPAAIATIAINFNAKIDRCKLN